MKDLDELENMTFWNITTNEGALTQLILGLHMLILSVMYVILDLYYKAKYFGTKKRW